jgi:imidazolonepropionase-like amidohydrolase
VKKTIPLVLCLVFVLWAAPAKAAAFGLDKREALRAVTLNAAEILGVADRMGSLEKGKAANIVLADGDILEFKTQVRKVFIDGRDMDLETICEQLLEKYKKRESK